MQCIKINSSNYSEWQKLCNASCSGNLLVPPSIQPNQWGVVSVESDMIIGGWVGTIRGNGRLSKYLAKSVYFDSYPIMQNGAEDKIPLLIDAVLELAKKDGIVQLNLTHWVRGENRMTQVLKDQCATFLIDMNASEEELWKGVDSKQRNIVRKGEKTGVAFEAYTGEASLAYLDVFQQLRQVTQSRAIGKNANASMLLKSNEFFRNIFLLPGATLFVGKYEGQVASVALMLQGGQTIYYYSGGSDREVNRKTGCSAYVIWKAIAYYKTRGDIAYFDMGGVPVRPTKEHPAYGVYEFKRSFGGEYQEFQNGHIVLCKWKYAILNFVLKNRNLLRILSKGGN